MNLAYKLNQSVSLDKVSKDIKKLCSKFSQEDLMNSVLVISLQKIVDYENESQVPKITYEHHSQQTDNTTNNS